MLKLFQRVASALGLLEPARQTTIGLEVPYSEPSTTSEALANLEYVQSEVKRCEASIKHDETRVRIHRAEAKWYLEYVAIAIDVAKDADMAHCRNLSDAAIWILPKINPYAEKVYDFEDIHMGSANMGKLMNMASEYKRGALKLGRAILEAKPDAPSMDARYTMQEDYDQLLDTHLTA